MSDKNYSTGSQPIVNVIKDTETSTLVASQDATSVPNTRKKRALTSAVWTHYQRVENNDGSVTAKCLYCSHSANASSTKGTTHLSTHIKNCKRRPRSDIKQILLGAQSVGSSSQLSCYKFDAEVERSLFAKMVIKHDYPFLFAEHKLFREWIAYVCPTYKFRSRNTVRNDCLTVFNEERGKLYKVIEGLSSRVSITTDLWTPDHQALGYCCVSCHYIDDSWKLCKKIIAFNYVDCPHTGEVLADWLKQKILEWNIDGKLSTIVVDNASNNEPMVNSIKSWLMDKGSLPCNGNLFHIRCCAHIINLIVKKGLEVISPLIEKIRDSVKYVGSSVYRNQKFKLALNQTHLSSNKKVGLDVETRWNSTYLMLESALDLKEAFVRLAELDKDYKCLPSLEQWNMGKKVCECLKVFYNITLQFSGTKYPTANYYFRDVWNIHYHLKLWQVSSDINIRTMAILMQSKFDKYWESCRLVLTVGLILDPRFKMQFVQIAYEEVYGERASTYIDYVSVTVNELFCSYVGNDISEDINDIEGQASKQIVGLQPTCDPITEKFLSYVKKAKTTSKTQVSELDDYLNEPLHPLKKEDPFSFDILKWWNINGAKFPHVRKMARDILAIPVSTVASESAFSWGRRIIDDTRSSLTPDIVEALLCTKDWLSPNDGWYCFLFYMFMF